MLLLRDASLRLTILNHFVARSYKGDFAALRGAGIAAEALSHLRELSTADLHRLAEMCEPTIAVRIDGQELKAHLQAIVLINEAKRLETYFLRHGAHWRMMRRFFKLGQKVTLQRRRECGSYRPSGRIQLPDRATRERICQVWAAIAEPDPRARFYRLHQAFQGFSLEVLERVVAEIE